jgi:hypothetical protein
MDERIKRALNPVKDRVTNHSVSLRAVREEVSPAVAKKISDSQEVVEDRIVGFERIVIDSLAAQRQEVESLHAKVNYIGNSVPPAAERTETAANRTEGKADALIKGQEITDKNLATTKKRTAATIALQVLGTALALAQIIERILHTGAP